MEVILYNLALAKSVLENLKSRSKDFTPKDYAARLKNVQHKVDLYEAMLQCVSKEALPKDIT